MPTFGQPRGQVVLRVRRNPPKIGALLRAKQLHQLEVATAGAFHIVAASSWGDLHLGIKGSPFRVLIIDPTFQGYFDEPAVVRLMTLFPCLPLIVYAKADAATFKGIAKLSRAGLEHVVIDRFDDSPDRLGALVRCVSEDALASRVIERIRTRLQDLPLGLAVAIEQVFQAPEQFHSALEVAREGAVPMARFYRSLEAAGLRSPKGLLMAARALRAFAYLRNPGHMVQDVAEKLGYFQARILAKHFHAVFGLNPGHSRHKLSESDAIERLVGFVERKPQGRVLTSLDSGA